MRTTIITPTTGRDTLRQAIASVAGQPCHHLVVIDGPEFVKPAEKILSDVSFAGSVVRLSENTGGDGFLCHRIYGAFGTLVNTEFVAHLDEDNWHGPEFVATMERFMDAHDRPVGTCRRFIHDEQGKLIGPDDIEAIGISDLGYQLFDTNTMFIRQPFAPVLTMHWYAKWGADRVVTEFLIRNNAVAHLKRHLTHYRAPERIVDLFR